MSLGVTPVGIFDYSRWYDGYTAEEVAFLKPIATIGAWGEPDLEKIAALQPDLIVGTADEVKDETYEQLSKLAPTALFAPTTRGDWEQTLTSVAVAAGAGDALGSGKTEFDALLARLSSDYRTALTEQT